MEIRESRPDEPLADRVKRLEQELRLALRWDRPSILLAVYASEFVRVEAETTLEAWLRNAGQSVARVQVPGPDDPAADVPRLLREWPDRDRTVFFVFGLSRGAPTTWNSLNVRREHLVDGRVRAVFWLAANVTFSAFGHVLCQCQGGSWEEGVDEN